MKPIFECIAGPHHVGELGARGPALAVGDTPVWREAGEGGDQEGQQSSPRQGVCTNYW